MKNEVTDKIRKIRVDKGISQENVADELSITASAYSKIERGETDPNLTRLFELAEILGVKIIEFFTGDEADTFKESKNLYGSISKGDIDNLNESILGLKHDIQLLRADLSDKKTPLKKRSNRK